MQLHDDVSHVASTPTVDRFAWEKAIRDDATLGDSAMPARTVKGVAFLLATYCRNGEAWVHLGTLAAKYDTTDRTIRTALSRLRDRGYLDVIFNGGPGESNRFFLHLPATPEASFPPRAEASFRQNMASRTSPEEQSVTDVTREASTFVDARPHTPTNRTPQEPTVTPPSPTATLAAATIAPMEPTLFDPPAKVRRPRAVKPPKGPDPWNAALADAFGIPAQSERAAWGHRKTLRKALEGRGYGPEVLPRLLAALKAQNPGWRTAPTPVQVYTRLDALCAALAADEAAARRDRAVAAASSMESLAAGWDDPTRGSWTDQEIRWVCSDAPSAADLLAWARPRRDAMTDGQRDAVRSAVARLRSAGRDLPQGGSMWEPSCPRTAA